MFRFEACITMNYISRRIYVNLFRTVMKKLQKCIDSTSTAASSSAIGEHRFPFYATSMMDINFCLEGSSRHRATYIDLPCCRIIKRMANKMNTLLFTEPF